jgi:hypothetical protein
MCRIPVLLPVLILAGLVAGWPAPSGGAPAWIADITFHQVDFVFLDSASHMNSAVGQIDVELGPIQSLYGPLDWYINVVTSRGWVVQNLPVPVGFPYPRISTNFDLGTNPAGNEDVTSLEAIVDISPAPLVAAPEGPPQSLPVTPVTFGGKGEELTTILGPFKTDSAGSLRFNLGADTYAIIQPGHPNVQAANNQCLPAALANSFEYLKGQRHVSIPHDNVPGLRGVPPNSRVGQFDIETSRAAGSRFSGDPVGTENGLKGKVRYIARNGLEDLLVIKHQGWYGGGDLQQIAGGHTANSKGAGATVTAKWLLKELESGEDVEMGFLYKSGGGHRVELIGGGRILGKPFVYHKSDYMQTNIDPGDSQGTDRVDFNYLEDTDHDGLLNLVYNKLDANVHSAFSQSPAPAKPLQFKLWDGLQDAFPFNRVFASLGPAYDTTTALVKTGHNIAPFTGDRARFDVPGDSMVVWSMGLQVRVDLVFRILPGPGNYVTIGRPDLGTLVKNPADVARAPISGPVPNSANFWESYLANNGPHGTPGGHAGGVWNPNVWNSARMDTVEATGLFAFQGRGILGGPEDVNHWQSTYHESELGIAPAPELGDPYSVQNLRGQLGIARHKCFLASASAELTDIDCIHDPPAAGIEYDLSYADAAHGYDGHPATTEGTKILPDGLFTPGTHIEYFFRRESVSEPVALMPDTNVVCPQPGEDSWDGQRWEGFSVLPDRWKAANYRHPVYGTFGLGEACLLVIDAADASGNERVWVSIADTLGATDLMKYGAHNGWHAAGTQDVNDPSTFVALHGGQPGTRWDLYQVRGASVPNERAGGFGSSLAYRDPSNPQIDNKASSQGPTPAVLKGLYRMILMVSDTLHAGILGPSADNSEDDVALLEDWLAHGSPSAPTRGFWALGEGFVESNIGEGPGSPQEDLMLHYFGASLRDGSYSFLSGNTAAIPDLLPIDPSMGTLGLQSEYDAESGTYISRADVLDLSGAVPEAIAFSHYENAPGGPYIAGVYKPYAPERPWTSLIEGWNLASLQNRLGGGTRGRHRYAYKVLSNVFGSGCTVAGHPVFNLDVPGTEGAAPMDAFLGIGNNPLARGAASVRFALSVRDIVEVSVFDVRGRRVRALANRAFEPGEHALTWDGTDDSGRRLPRGVYFTQVRFPNRGFSEARKLTILK